MILLDLLELHLRIASAQLDVGIRRAQLLGQIHLQTLGSSDHDMRTTVVLEELREAETGGTGAEHEHA